MATALVMAWVTGTPMAMASRLRSDLVRSGPDWVLREQAREVPEPGPRCASCEARKVSRHLNGRPRYGPGGSRFRETPCAVEHAAQAALQHPHLRRAEQPIESRG